MYCKECGTENEDNSLRCSKCNTYLKSSDSPLTGGNRTKIISFFAFLILPFAWFGGSILIILIAIFALYIMKKDQSFTPIINAKKYMKAYLIFIAVGSTAIIIYNNGGTSDRIFPLSMQEETLLVAIITIVVSSIAVSLFSFIFNSLFFRPLEEHKNWIIKNGIFSDEKDKKVDLTNIVGRDNLSSYSVADELLKWNDLLEKGLISKEEFTNAKAKLLHGEKV